MVGLIDDRREFCSQCCLPRSYGSSRRPNRSFPFGSTRYRRLRTARRARTVSIPIRSIAIALGQRRSIGVRLPLGDFALLELYRLLRHSFKSALLLRTREPLGDFALLELYRLLRHSFKSALLLRTREHSRLRGFTPLRSIDRNRSLFDSRHSTRSRCRCLRCTRFLGSVPITDASVPLYLDAAGDHRAPDYSIDRNQCEGSGGRGFSGGARARSKQASRDRVYCTWWTFRHGKPPFSLDSRVAITTRTGSRIPARSSSGSPRTRNATRGNTTVD